MTDKIPDLFELFDGSIHTANVVECYDGDTITIVLNIPKTEQKVKVKCRMLGYDTPEIRTLDKNEKKIGLLARDRLRELILNKEVQVKTKGGDKYGRMLINVDIGDTNVNNYMIDSNLGHPYGGGTKNKVTYLEDNSYIRNGTTYVVSKSNTEES